MIILLGILSMSSVLPFGSFIKERSLTYLSENSSNPIEQIANTRFEILNSGKSAHLNLYFLFLCISLNVYSDIFLSSPKIKLNAQDQRIIEFKIQNGDIKDGDIFLKI